MRGPPGAVHSGRVRWFRVVPVLLLLAGCTAAAPPAPPPAPIDTIAIAGNRFVDKAGKPLTLRGFNLSGAEYSCIEGDGFFDTPDGRAPGDRVLAAMRGWGRANAVRVPLNEQCWLGLPAAPPAFAGERYRSEVVDFVRRLNGYGFVAVLDLHRTAPADGVSRNQEPMPDRDHSPAFWQSMATTFRTGAVVFDLFNEPFPFSEPDSERARACWRDGCAQTSVNTGREYPAAGMNELVAAVRGTGSTTPLLAGGIFWAEKMDGWLTYRPTDPAGQLGASFHAYSFNTSCRSPDCYDRDLKPIMAQVPLLAGEVGPSLRPEIADVDHDCPPRAVRRGGWADETLDWFDENGAGWTAWSWNPWGDCWSLTKDWGGEPTSVWGKELRRRLAAS
jgi:endoglucanase